MEIEGRPGGCEQVCVNFAGSYECSCGSGFFIQEDGKSCGMFPPGELELYIAAILFLIMNGYRSFPSLLVPT